MAVVHPLILSLSKNETGLPPGAEDLDLSAHSLLGGFDRDRIDYAVGTQAVSRVRSGSQKLPLAFQFTSLLACRMRPEGSVVFIQ